MDKREHRELLKKQVEEFLANGGEVTKVAPVPAPKQVSNRVYNSTANVIGMLMESRRY